MASWSRSRSWRILCLLTLCCFLAGCSGYGPATLTPRPLHGEHGDGPPPPQVRKGMEVHVTTVEGKVLTGTVVDLTDDTLTIAKAGNYGLQETEIPFADITRVESPQASAGARVVAGVLTFMGITVVTLLALLIYACRDGCFGD